MRTLTQHIVDGDSTNHQLEILVLDEPGSGGANHSYTITADDTNLWVDVTFQNGPIREVGINGITHEALLAILIDRLEGFQSGPYANSSNEDALIHMRQALHHLQTRTRERIARGVEGTHKQ